ncbi:EAL domain-containing protein [Croceicoccus sp. F390]|uniref:EAL domain-containing protein n=1 Tax=Croceicoccus esteveae TaxID=3075597 RepID=A0ABU2ZEU3_9SPHN|nr:EAL domain-containing protein [Croceicoccus sp. F390]MDT0575120.1 EAL domain-containing protein [Croceicoccus sp. F390]
MPAKLVPVSQLLISALAAAFLALAGISDPLDEAFWVTTSQFMPKPVSDELVLINVTNPASGAEQSIAASQAKAIRALSAYRPEAIFLQGSFSRGDSGVAELQAAIAATTVPVTVGWQKKLAASDGGLRQVLGKEAQLPGATDTLDVYFYSALGYPWKTTSVFSLGTQDVPVFPAAIAGKPHQEEPFLLDYHYQSADFTVYALDQVARGIPRDNDLAGKRIIIGTAAAEGLSGTKIPGGRVPSIYVTLIAAETLIQGAPDILPWFLPLGLVCLILLISIWLQQPFRRPAVTLAVLIALLLPIIAADWNSFAQIGAALLCTLLFIALRARSAWQARAANTDNLSGLPNFNALQEEMSSDSRLIVTRVARFEEILASLEPSLHKQFVQQIEHRLSIGREGRLYTDGTGHFAWFDPAASHDNDHVTGLLALANAPLVVGNRNLDFACSFGILDSAAAKPQQAVSATVVAAEAAASRPSHVAFVSEQTGKDAQWQLSLHAALDHAIAHDQIYLEYQPQRDLATWEIIGAEALVRWRHPERGEISPAEFIPQVEKAGRLLPLTAHILRSAARAIGSHPAPDRRIAVNISASLISKPDFVEFVCSSVADGGAPFSAITLEITETTRIPDVAAAATNLSKLRERGFAVSLDDFGTGEANLSLLVDLPCDELKIDRSFVRLAQDNDRARMIIAAVAQTASHSNLRLVAEGIETTAELEILRSLGCSIGQGYLLGRPKEFGAMQEQFASGKSLYRN